MTTRVVSRTTNVALVNVAMANAPQARDTIVHAAPVPKSAIRALSVRKQNIWEARRYAWIQKSLAVGKMKGGPASAMRTVNGGLSVRIRERVFRRLQATSLVNLLGIDLSARNRTKSSARVLRWHALRIRTAVRRIARPLRFCLFVNAKNNRALGDLLQMCGVFLIFHCFV